MSAPGNNVPWPDETRRAVMNRTDAATLWHDETGHLVRAHGADADRLLALGLNLGKTQWVHFDTHAALDIAQVRPPDGHAHPVLGDPENSASLRTWDRKTETWQPVIPNPEDPSEPLVYYRPFRGSGYARGRTVPYRGPKYVVPSEYTSLPQTEMCPPHDADVTGRWAVLAIALMRRHLQGIASEGPAWRDPTYSSSLPRRLLARREELARMDPEQVIAGFRAEIRDLAASATNRWQHRTSIPARSADRASARWLASITSPAVPAGQGTALARPGRRS